MDRHTRSLVPLVLLLPSLLACSQGAARQTEPAQDVIADLQPSPDTVRPAAVQDGLASSRRNAIVTAAQRVSPAVVSINGNLFVHGGISVEYSKQSIDLINRQVSNALKTVQRS